MKITKEMLIGELMNKSPESGVLLFNAGMACAGCPLASQETIEQGCLAHGMSEEEINKLINAINNQE